MLAIDRHLRRKVLIWNRIRTPSDRPNSIFVRLVVMDHQLPWWYPKKYQNTDWIPSEFLTMEWSFGDDYLQAFLLDLERPEAALAGERPTIEECDPEDDDVEEPSQKKRKTSESPPPVASSWFYRRPSYGLNISIHRSRP